MENIINELNQIQKKDEKEWDKKDKCIWQVFGKILQILGRQVLEKLTSQLQQSQQNVHKISKTFHYAFITPSKANSTRIRERVFRPVFIAANLIKKEDNLNRLLFFSTLERSVRHIKSVPANRCYFTNKVFFNIGRNFQRIGAQYLVCEVLVYGEGLLSLKCDAFNFSNFLPVDSHVTGLGPLISSSILHSFPIQKIAKNNLSNLIKDKGCEKQCWENEIELEKFMNTIMEYFETFVKVNHYFS